MKGDGGYTKKDQRPNPEEEGQRDGSKGGENGLQGPLQKRTNAAIRSALLEEKKGCPKRGKFRKKEKKIEWKPHFSATAVKKEADSYR